MITGHVPAVRLLPDHADRRMAAAIPARGGVADHRDLDLAPPARRATAAAAMPPETDLGGPRPARDPARRDPQSAAPRTALLVTRTPSCAGTATSSAAAGPPSPHAARAAGHPPEHQDPDPPAGPREPRMGIPPDPR